MKVLLTGVGGFIGSYLAQKWQDRDNELICVCRNRKPEGLKAKVIYSDLSKELKFNESVDVIVHAAAQSPAPGIVINDYIKSNIDSVNNIIEYAKRMNVKKIIYLSSVSIYGEVRDLVVDEDTELVNPDIYGMTKYIGEKLLCEASDISVIALRLPGVIGKGATTPWLAKVMDKLRRGRKVEIYNHESLFNNLIHVEDLEIFINSLINMDWKGFIKLTLACKEALTVEKVAYLLRDYMNSSSEIELSDLKRNSFTISIDRAIKMGFNPMSVKDALYKYSNDYN